MEHTLDECFPRIFVPHWKDLYGPYTSGLFRVNNTIKIQFSNKKQFAQIYFPIKL